MEARNYSESGAPQSFMAAKKLIPEKAVSVRIVRRDLQADTSEAFSITTFMKAKRVGVAMMIRRLELLGFLFPDPSWQSLPDVYLAAEVLDEDEQMLVEFLITKDVFPYAQSN